MMRRIWVAAFIVSLVSLGCNSPGKRLNAPPHGETDNPSNLRETYTQMTDNALLSDMTMNDSHFLPHRALMNDLGLRRLNRLAELIEAYGGTICLNTDETDESLIARRMQAIVDYLSEVGLDTTDELVVVDMPGGTGMLASEAILIKQKEGTYDPKKKSSAASATPAPAPAK